MMVYNFHVNTERDIQQTSPVCLAVAMAGDGVTVHGVLLNTVANLIASVPEEALFTTILAQRAGETSRTRARACVCIDKITRVLSASAGKRI